MKLSKQQLVDWFPVLSRYIGICGVIYEVVLMRVWYHLPPDPTSIMIFAGMMGFAEVQSAMVRRDDSQQQSQSRPEPPKSEPTKGK